jgi:hypothetical protein
MVGLHRITVGGEPMTEVSKDAGETAMYAK